MKKIKATSQIETQKTIKLTLEIPIELLPKEVVNAYKKKVTK